ncbi:MAG: translocation/assembly module TamB domain-containing protein [Bryobacteraceae bacterium]
MSRTKRAAVIGASAVCAVLLLIGMGALWMLQSRWFKEKVQQRIIVAAEKVSGGRVSLGSFDYNWRTLSADFRNFVVHGTEPSGAPVLFQADSIHVAFRIVSLIKRDVDISSIAIERPEVHLLVRPDGTTNLPSPKVRRNNHGTVEELLNLKLRHIEIEHGAIYAEMRRVPFSARGEDVFILASYDRAGPRYNARISSSNILFASDQMQSLSARMNAALELEKDRLIVQHVELRSQDSDVRVSGIFQQFARPRMDLNVSCIVGASSFANLTGFADVRGGRLVVTGAAHYDESTQWTFGGKLGGRDLAYVSNRLALKNINFDSEISADGQEVRFTHVAASARAGKFAGQAVLKKYRELELDGRVNGVEISAAAPWSGKASGAVHVSAMLHRGIENFALQSELQISPAPGPVPVSGSVDLSYKWPSGAVEFGNSHLNLPRSQLSFSGILGADLHVVADSTDLNELKPVLAAAISRGAMACPVLLKNGSAHFDGTIAGPLVNPRIQGNVAVADFRAHGQQWDQIHSRIDVSRNGIEFSSLVADAGSLHATGSGSVGLENWMPRENSSIRLEGQFKGANAAKIFSEYVPNKLPIEGGMASGSMDVSGRMDEPEGSAKISIDNAEVYGERVNRIEVSAALASDQLQITRGRMRAASALVSFSGMYNHARGSWRAGQFHLKVDSNEFPLASLASVNKYEPGLNAQFEIHAEAGARVADGRIEPADANGTMAFRKVTVNSIPYGSILLTAATRGDVLNATFQGDLRETHVSGNTQIQLIAGSPAKGDIRFDQIQIGTIYALLNSGSAKGLPFNGFVQGGITFEGPLQQPDRVRATIRLQELEVSSNAPLQAEGSANRDDLVFRNAGPIVLEAIDGVANIRSFEITGRDTELRVTGSIPYLEKKAMNLKLEGSIDLRIFHLFDRNVQASGQSVIAASLEGTLAKPSVNGTLEMKNGSFFLNDIPNGLTAVNGTVRFDRDRATIQKLTGRSGGGELSLAGFVSFGARPLVYQLEANAENVRVRYGGGISVTAASELRLSGTSENSLLSGTVAVSRVVLSQNTDVGTVLAALSAPAPTPTNPNDFLTGLQLDIRLESTPNLQLSTAVSRDLEAQIDLRLRGTPNDPVLLGSIVANQGEVKVFGTNYRINRGEVSFFSPVKIEPVLDLDLQTQARGITVEITISGAIGKLNINYRSDPPLQPRDIIALLTVGRTPNTASNISGAQATSDVSALESGANTVLGQAISPASNRLSKLFGITNIKIDPLVQGITNTPQSRLTIEQQISREITVTYVTNLSQTSEQIFRLEWALNTQYSIVALRDDNGEFGIDIQYRKRFK